MQACLTAAPDIKLFLTKPQTVYGFLLPTRQKKFFGLLQLNLSSGARQLFSWPCYRKIRDHDHTSEGMCYDKKRDCIWINSNDGLLQFTLSDKQFHHVDAPDKLPDLKDYEKGFDLWHWVGIDIDKKKSHLERQCTKGNCRL
jgi:hypothetical protein